MKCAAGLIGAGRLTDSPLARTWHLKDCLGPVKSPTLRVASRIANTLRAGRAVADYAPFDNCNLIIISVPDKLVDSIIQELSEQPFAWTNKAVVLYSPDLGVNKLEAFRKAHALAGSIAAIPGFEDRWFLVEGEKAIETRLRPILDTKNTRVTVVRPGLKPLYLAAIRCAGPLFQPMLVAANEAMINAGIPVTQAAAILEKQIDRSMRGFLKGGRKALSSEGLTSGLLQAVENHDRKLAKYLEKLSQASQDILAPADR